MKYNFSSIIGILLFCVLAFLIGYISSTNLFLSPPTLVVFAFGVLTLLICFINQKIGIILAIILSFLISLVYRMFIDVDIPLGTAIETIILSSFSGIFFKKLSMRDYNWNFIKDPITYALGILLLFNAIQFFNPFHINPAVTFLLVKRQVCMFLFYVICVYLFQEKKFMFSMLKFWIALSFIVALYACYQEWFGFFPFETKWLFSSDDILRLFYIGGKFRKFSILNNPTIMGIIVSMSAIFIITLLTAKFSLSKKLFMIFMIIIMLMAVGYSGTRTAYAMIAGGFFLLMLMNIHKTSTIFLAAAGGILFITIMYGPYTNQTILRIRSAFYPENDASYNERDKNRAAIRPFIFSHPIGAGLGTTGPVGLNMNPGQQLAGFPPDSEYLKVTLETGFIGYFILLLSYFIILNALINRYYRIYSNQLKIYYSALTVTLFSLIIANYAQETSGMLPNDIIFYILFAFGASIYKFDINFNKKLRNYET
jgi:putative inorganic carbon (HCO3(-)) transporter